jgi:septal ring factor EnvC (AmiA/AmiB activator)
VTLEQGDLILEILKRMQGDMTEIKREVSSQSMRLSALEDHVRGLVTTIYGIQSDVSDLKMRVDRIERRLGLTDTEH